MGEPQTPAGPASPQSAASESRRLAKLRSYQILDTLPEEVYDDITYLAANICDCPIALVSLVDADRQWFKSKVGLDTTETPREVAFCAHAIGEPNALTVVADAQEDERFTSNPLVVSEPSIRFYAGAPLTMSDGHAIGALCVIDRKPRQLTLEQSRALSALSRQVITQLELRLAVGKLEKYAAERRRYEQMLEAYQKELVATNVRLAEQSITDSLTGLHNRRSLMVKLEEECQRAERYSLPLSFVLVDVDQFKAYNDSFGHPAGDEVLMQVAALLERDRRSVDFVARQGGEEFGLVLSNTDRKGALAAADAARQAVESHPWPNRPVTISVGVASFDGRITDSSALISAADSALYAAKESGRNRVALASAS